MFCVSCGARVPEGARFCPECGAGIGAAPQPRSGGHTTLVSACCTNCGAGLQVDPGLQAAVCPFCNTPYIVERAIQNFNITNNYIVQGADTNNLLTLAQDALRAGNYGEAAAYSDRVLEAEPGCLEGWLCKIRAAGHDIDGDRSAEITALAQNALDHGSTGDEERVYAVILEVAALHLGEAAARLAINMDRIHRQLRDHRDHRDISAMDNSYIINISTIANEAVEYRSIVPDTAVSSSRLLQEKATALADAYEKYYDALCTRMRSYSDAPSARAKDRKKEIIRRILSGTGSSGARTPEKKSFWQSLFG